MTKSWSLPHVVGAGVEASAYPAHVPDLILHSVCNVVFSAMIFCVYTLIVGVQALVRRPVLLFQCWLNFSLLQWLDRALSPLGFFVVKISFPVTKGGIVWTIYWSKAISCRLFGYQFQVGTILSQWDLSWSLSPALSHRLPFQTRQGGLSIAPSTCDRSFWCGYLFQVGTSPPRMELFV